MKFLFEVIGGRRGSPFFRLARLALQLVDEVAHFDNGAVGQFDAAGDDRLGQFRGAHFDHVHRFTVSGHHHVHLGEFHLAFGGVHHILAVDIRDTAGGCGAFEGNVRNGKGGRRADHGKDVRFILQVGGHDHRLDKHFVAVTLGKHRADGAVDQPHGENFLVGRPGLAFEKTAGKLARGVGLFTIVDGQREEIDTGTRRSVYGRGEHRGFAIGNKDRSRRLACDLTGFQTQRASADVLFHYDMCHDCVTLFFWSNRYLSSFLLFLNFRMGGRLVRFPATMESTLAGVDGGPRRERAAPASASAAATACPAMSAPGLTCAIPAW